MLFSQIFKLNSVKTKILRLFKYYNHTIHLILTWLISILFVMSHSATLAWIVCIHSHFHSQKWLKMWYLSPILVIVFIDKRFYASHCRCSFAQFTTCYHYIVTWWVAVNIILLCSSRNCTQPKQQELGNIQTSAKQNKGRTW